MSNDAQQLLDQAMALPAEERAKLAEKLLESLDHDNQREIDEAWLDEVQRREAALEAGETSTIPAEDVFRRLRDRKK
jgi:putative addiction module component (TIGR02574 family)